MKKVIYGLCALWALLVFTITLLIVYLPVALAGLIPEPRRTVVVFALFRAWMSLFFLLSGVRRKYTGRHHFAPGQRYVVVCNHRSFMDVPLTSPGIPGANKTIAKIEMARIPVFGLIYRRGSVIVDRKNEESRRASYGKMKEVLAMGMHMCIYPEGTRNKGTAPLQRFHDGAFRLAVETGTPVIPAVIRGTARILPPAAALYFRPGRVSMKFLPPVPSVGKSVEGLKSEVFGMMEAELLNPQP